MSVFSNIKPTNHIAKNGFDQSAYDTFSSKPGFVLPVRSFPTLPDGEYQIDLQQLCRTQPLQTAAFAGFSLNYDVVFIPYNHLYSSFNQFIAQRENKNLVRQPSYSQIPTFDLNGFVTILLIEATWDYIVAAYGVDRWRNRSAFASSHVPIFLTYSKQCPQNSMSLEALRSLDMFGYGNYLPVVKALADFVVNNSGSWSDDDLIEQILTDSGMISEIQGVYNFSRDVWFEYVNRLQGFTELMSNALQNSFGLKPNLWPVLAYNKCFYEYYRNTYYDTSFEYFTYYTAQYGDDSEDYVSLFNFDDWSSRYNELTVVQDSSSHEYYRLLCMFAIKPHLYKRDLFTAVLPDTQFGDVSLALENNPVHRILNTAVPDSNNTAIIVGATSPSQAGSLSRSNVGLDNKWKFDPAIAISVLESRRADAMQRFKERMLRAGDKTKDIFKAHGWTEPRSENAFEPVFLGSFDGRLDINTVAATAESDNYDVGQLGANGVSIVRGQKIRFKSSDFGLILVLFHIEKDAIYNSYGLKLEHSLTEPFDYPYPELQGIQLRPLEKTCLSLVGLAFQNGVNDVLGYLPANMAYKTSVDLVHGEFYSNFPYYALYGSTSSQDGEESFLKDGVFSDWVAPRKDLQNASDLSFLYVQPSCADSIFTVRADALQSSDQFLVNVAFDFKAVNPLDVIGLPI